MNAESKRFTHIDALWQSFFSHFLYVEVARRWRGVGFLHRYLVHQLRGEGVRNGTGGFPVNILRFAAAGMKNNIAAAVRCAHARFDPMGES